jgi:hypothetical protein
MRVTTVILSLLLAGPAFAQADPLAITAKEKAACGYDAARFCASTYPDEMKLVSCMEANRASLSKVCRPVLDAGLKRRGL